MATGLTTDTTPVPEGYTYVELLPQQTGLRQPMYTMVKKEVVERDIDPETGTDRSLPKVRANLYDNRVSQYGIFPVSYTHLTLPTIYSV